MHLNDLDEIRIVINTGAGLGHQKANITLMQRLRELGFNGVFDVRYYEIYPLKDDTYSELEKLGYLGKAIAALLPEDPLITQQRSHVGSIGRVLQILIPTFIPNDFSKDDPGQLLDASYLGIGKIRLTRLPAQFYDGIINKLPLTKLTMTAADDLAMPDLTVQSPVFDQYRKNFRSPALFSSEMYACLQPTNWYGCRFVKNSNNDTYIDISDDAILLSNTNLIVDPKMLTSVEMKILELIHHEAYQTQFFYTSQATTLKRTSPSTLYSILERAHGGIRKTKQKPLLILMPRPEGNADIDLLNSSIESIPLGRPIIKINIGNVSQAMFEYLLRETTYPPLLEGANSIAYCEEKGIPYIHCLDSGDLLMEYDVEDKSMQTLHMEASLCMYLQNIARIPSLQKYLKLVGEKNDQVLAYHKDRAKKLHERPDACEKALKSLNITYNTSVSQYKKIKIK